MACLERDTKPYRTEPNGIGNASHNSGVLALSGVLLRLTRSFRRQGKMSSRFFNAAGTAAIAAMLMLSTQTASAQITFPWERSQQQQGYPQGQPQSDDADMEMRIQRLESQLRQLTGQNE